jgi:hypothetical protein
MWSQRAENGSRSRDGKGLSRSFASWAAAREHVDGMIAYLWKYYRDIEECVDWSKYLYQEAPHGVIWRHRVPAYMHSIDISTIEGLYVASETSEDPQIPQDSEASVALRAIELATMQRGHLWGAPRARK